MRCAREDFTVALHNLALIVHQDQRVVGHLGGVALMLLSRKREHAPDLRITAVDTVVPMLWVAHEQALACCQWGRLTAS